MRIGDLARRTGVPTRLLRYYEAQALLAPARDPNGYRAYAETAVARVRQIRGLLDAGLPTAIIADVLPCLADPCTIRGGIPSPVLDRLAAARDRLAERAACLARHSAAIDAYLAAARALGPVDGPGVGAVAGAPPPRRRAPVAVSAGPRR